MPITPLHFGPHAVFGLPLQRRLDLPVFLLANVAIDLEPLTVMVLDLDMRLHGFFHTLLFGGLIGLAWGLIGYRLRHLFHPAMSRLGLSYRTSPQKALLSGLAGAWLHLLFDAPLYGDMRPLYPLPANPLLEILPSSFVYNLCLLCLPLAIALWLLVRTRHQDAGAD